MGSQKVRETNYKQRERHERVSVYWITVPRVNLRVAETKYRYLLFPIARTKNPLLASCSAQDTNKTIIIGRACAKKKEKRASSASVRLHTPPHTTLQPNTTATSRNPTRHSRPVSYKNTFDSNRDVRGKSRGGFPRSVQRRKRNARLFYLNA